jgi:hypothetical protein
MKLRFSIRDMLWLTALVAVLIGSCGYFYLHVQIAFADEQTMIFDEMREKAIQSTSPSDIAKALDYVVAYYPSGTKQRVGSKLDLVVERHRTAVVRDIVARLRSITGRDLGADPECWIKEYAAR